MSNPVASQPPAGDGTQPPAHEGFGSAPAQPVPPAPPSGAPAAEGQPVPGQPVPGQPVPGQPYGDPAQQGFGDAPAAPAKKKSAVGRTVLRILGAIVVFVVILVVKDQFFGDKAKDAAVGDCVASTADVKVDEETDAEAKVVDCGASDAAYTVVGRVNGESDVKSKSCEKFFQENEEYFVYGSPAKGGYLLCLRPKAA